MTTTKVKRTPVQRSESVLKPLTFQAKFGFLSRAWAQIVNLAVIQYNLMPYFWELTRQWQATYLGSNYQGEVSLLPIELIIDYPFSYVYVCWTVAVDVNQCSLVLLSDFCH